MNILSLLALDTKALAQSWEIMWKGVVAIFVVIALIIIVTKIVNKFCVDIDTKRAEKAKAKDAENQNDSNP